MKANLKTQFLALLIVLSLGALTGLEPALHNHDLDLHGEHKDCSSCSWTEISIDNSSTQTIIVPYSFDKSANQTRTDKPLALLTTSSLSRAPPALS